MDRMPTIAPWSDLVYVGGRFQYSLRRIFNTSRYECDYSFEGYRSFIDGYKRTTICSAQPQTAEVSMECPQMSRQSSCNGLLPFMIMAREDIAERINEVARKYIELARKYAETRDDKKIVEELYALLRELGKLKEELLH